MDRHRLLVEIAALREESQLYKAELTELEELHRTHAENDAPNSDAATDIGQNPAFYLRRPQVSWVVFVLVVPIVHNVFALQTSLVNRSSVLDPQDNLLDRPRVADPGTSFSGRPRSSYAAPRVSRLDLGSFSRPRRPAPFGATGQDFVRDHNEWLARLRRSEPRSTGVTDVSANPSFHRPGAGGF